MMRFYEQAATTLVDENGEAMERPLKDPGLILKYSTHKNMASMAADSGDINTAMEHYLQVHKKLIRSSKFYIFPFFFLFLCYFCFFFFLQVVMFHN